MTEVGIKGHLQLNRPTMFRSAVLLAVVIASCSGDQGMPVDDLFMKVDVNNDDQLTRVEFYNLLFLFDTDKDNSINPTEFVNSWVNIYNIGSEDEAQALFTRVDTNDDGYITSQDIPAMFSYFDTNGDGLVDISEFLTQWGSLKSEGTDDLNETIDITG